MCVCDCAGASVGAGACGGVVVVGIFSYGCQIHECFTKVCVGCVGVCLCVSVCVLHGAAKCVIQMVVYMFYNVAVGFFGGMYAII